MAQTIQAQDISLNDLETKFKLAHSQDNHFFREWRDELPVSESEKHFLDRIKSNYLNLIKYPPMLENAVKMVVLSPLLDLAGFYQHPFRISTEKSVEIISEDEGTIVKGKIAVLVLQEQLWILVIEAKKPQFSLELGIPQALAYMTDTPNFEQPTFGFVTNGSNFIFIKLMRQDTPIYALSDEFTLRRANDLYNVLSVLKKLGILNKS